MAADGVDKRSPLLSAYHSGNITPTAPPYLTRKQPQSGTPTSVHSHCQSRCLWYSSNKLLLHLLPIEKISNCVPWKQIFLKQEWNKQKS
eukprot:bmy_21893T0